MQGSAREVMGVQGIVGKRDQGIESKMQEIERKKERRTDGWW